MSKKLQELVRDFMVKYRFKRGILYSARGTAHQKLRWHKITAARVRLIMEEACELAEAFRTEDVVKAADAVGDLLYLVYGTAATIGFDADPIVREIHRSNMTKFPGGQATRRQDGKVVKPDSWSPPDLAQFL